MKLVTISRGMFVTMLIGLYDGNNKELLLSNAGHEPPVIHNTDGSFTNFNEAGPPLVLFQTQNINTKFLLKKAQCTFLQMELLK